jgi:hypothetical protein
MGKDCKMGEESYQVDGDGPFIDGQVDFPGEIVEMAHQAGHYLGQARVSIGPCCSNDFVGESEIITLLAAAKVVFGFAERADIDGRVR